MPLMSHLSPLASPQSGHLNRGTAPLYLCALLFTASLAFPTPAKADDIQSQIDINGNPPSHLGSNATDDRHWTIGLGVGIRTNVYAHDDGIKFNALPLVRYDNGPYHIGVQGFAYDVYQEKDLTITASISPRLAPQFPSDTPLFDNINRDLAVEAGAGLHYEMRPFYVSAQGRVDISTAHDGYELQIKAGRKIALGFGFLDVGIGGIFQDEKLSTYLYGVKADEANSLRAEYSPDGEWRPFVDANLMIPIEDNVSLLTATSYKALGDSIQDSPLVDASAEFQTTLALIYKF